MTALERTPSHWRRTTIGEIAEVRLGRQRSPKNHRGELMRPYLRAANIDWCTLRTDDILEMNFTDEEMETYALRVNDILVVEGSGSAPEVGKCALVPDRFAGHAFQNTLIRVRPSEGIDAAWLMYRINAEAKLGGFLALAHGSGIFHLGSTRTNMWPVAVPPLQEQRAIVEAAERMLSHFDAAQRGRKQARRRLPLLRDAVVNAAITGVPPSTASAIHASQELQQVNSAVERRQTKVTPQAPPSWLPDGWAWVTLETAVGDAGLVADGDWVETKDQDPDGEIRLLQLADVGKGFFRDRSNRHINEEAARRLGVTEVLPGDVLVARLGDPPGDATIVPDLGVRMITAVDVCIVRPVAGAARPEWLQWCFNSPQFRAAVVEHQSGTTRKRISRAKLEQLCVPVPPREVQDQLVRCIREQMSRADRLEASLDAVEERENALRRSILKAAFEGRLTNTSDSAPSDHKFEEAIA